MNGNRDTGVMIRTAGISGSFLFHSDLLTDHEPKRACVGATASWTAAALRRFGGVKGASRRGAEAPLGRAAKAEGLAHSKTWRHIQRFMGSLHDSKIAHRDHEPGRDALLRVQADRQVGPTRFMERALLALAATVLCFRAAAAPSGDVAAARADLPKMPFPLKVVGTRILNSQGQPVILRGVNCPSLEWTCDGQGHILQTVNTAIREWHANIIRLPLSQDRWFGKTSEQQDGGAFYRSLAGEIVDACATQGCYIILDLHWSDCGEWGRNIGQHSMPDLNSVAFWSDCAARFRNHPAVLFDLYNEPHDVPWDVWLNGGTIKDKPNGRRAGPPRTFQAVGMQKLLDAARVTGANNVVVAGGLDWAYDFSGILEGVQLLDQKGNGVIYANHAYDNKDESAGQWVVRMEKAAAQLPVIVSEYGGSGGPHRRAGRSGGRRDPSGDDWLLHVMQGLQDHRWSWTAWSFHPSAGPTLISDWDYTPTPDFGVFVQQALAGTLPPYTPPPRPQIPRADAPAQRSGPLPQP